MWRPKDLGMVIAQRELTFETSAGKRTALLRIGKPVRAPTPEDEDPWWCPIQFESLDPSAKVYAIGGVDQLHSLLLALDFARKMVPHFAEKAGGKAYWDEAEMDCIFPQRATIDAYVESSAEVFALLREVLDALADTKGPVLTQLRGKVA